MQRFTELKVWQRGHSLVLAIYRLSVGFPLGERYGLLSQLRRAALSIPTSSLANDTLLANVTDRNERRVRHLRSRSCTWNVLFAFRVFHASSRTLERAERQCSVLQNPGSARRCRIRVLLRLRNLAGLQKTPVTVECGRSAPAFLLSQNQRPTFSGSSAAASKLQVGPPFFSSASSAPLR